MTRIERTHNSIFAPGGTQAVLWYPKVQFLHINICSEKSAHYKFANRLAQTGRTFYKICYNNLL